MERTASEAERIWASQSPSYAALGVRLTIRAHRPRPGGLCFFLFRGHVEDHHVQKPRRCAARSLRCCLRPLAFLTRFFPDPASSRPSAEPLKVGFVYVAPDHRCRLGAPARGGPPGRRGRASAGKVKTTLCRERGRRPGRRARDPRPGAAGQQADLHAQLRLHGADAEGGQGVSRTSSSNPSPATRPRPTWPWPTPATTKAATSPASRPGA